MESTSDAPPRSEEKGNTKPTPRRNNSKLHHVFTWNNYPDDWKTYFCSNIYVKIAAQEETGESGTKHIQGYFQLDRKRRWTELHLPKQIHFEDCKSPPDAIEYCTKDSTRTGERFLRGITLKKSFKTITPTYKWQLKILSLINEEPNDRHIYWFWENEGGVGKTSFAKYLTFFHNAIPLEGKKSDILYCAAEHESDIYIYDIPRSLDNRFLSYESIEKIKNGYFMCGKYESRPITRNPPHVFIFANNPPDTSKLSADRWVIENISKE